MGYSFEELEPFVATLKNTKFEGDLCLFISKTNKKTYRMLRKYGIKLIPFQEEYPFTLDLAIPEGLLDENLSSRKISVKYLRYILYYLYLSKYRSKYSKVLITDVKDVIFQRNPFAFNFDKGLCCFIEDSSTTIKTSPFNSGRIKAHFGDELLEKIGDNHPLCSGTTFGYLSEMMEYLKKMINLFSKINLDGGGDQGLHNYLIYTEPFKDLKIYNGDYGPVFTFGSKLNRNTNFNKDGLLVSSKGKVFNIVHQYDRHPELFEKFFKRQHLNLPLNYLLRLYFLGRNRFEDTVGWDFFNRLGWKFVNRLGLKIK